MSAEGAELNPVTDHEAELTLSDGVQLRSRLWHPQRGGPWPALLMRQPYGRSIASTVTYAHPRWWAEQGYLVVVQDVRGQGDSEGQFGGFGQEASDSAETHAWVRARPECNGRLGCYGFSYQGLTQLLAPADAPPPECLAPAMAGLDERRDWCSEGGAHWWHLGLGWGLQLAALQARRKDDEATWLTLRRSLEDGSYLREGRTLLERHDPGGMACRWFQQDPLCRESWTVHTPPRPWLQRPMLLLGGWWDPHLLGILDLWQRSTAVGGAPELHIGPATHLQWWPQAQRLMLQFFDRHLKLSTDSPTSDTSPRFWDLTRQDWYDSPPATQHCWQLKGDGLSSIDLESGFLDPEEPGKGTVTIVHDPWRPVPAIGGHLSPDPGPAERGRIDERADVATFTGCELGQQLQLQGQPVLTLQASADQPGFDLCVALSRLPRDSTQVQQLSTGVLRMSGEAARTLAQRRILLQPLLATLHPGDRMRVSIAGSAWPAVGVNPGTPEVASGAPGSRHRIVTMTLELAGSQLSLIPFDSGRVKAD